MSEYVIMEREARYQTLLEEVDERSAKRQEELDKKNAESFRRTEEGFRRTRELMAKYGRSSKEHNSTEKQTY
ncbi:hypothetical protein FACS1894152_8430 [Bacilli bacterium]|nr:hypothetical protein FACS1894152_8430 [Bacilli bacterium]